MNFDAPFDQRPWPLRWLYWGFRSVLMGVMVIVCGVRAKDRRHIPPVGKTLLMANHASYDVVVIGIAQPRNIDFMARSGLFVPGLGLLIRCLGGFPIQRGSGGASGIKETLKRLKQDAMIGMFPEGTRTIDGDLQPIKPGVTNISRRSGATVVCAGIAGGFEAWPRHCPWPGSYPIDIVYAAPIVNADFEGKSEDEALRLLESRMADAFREAKADQAAIRSVMMF